MDTPDALVAPAVAGAAAEAVAPVVPATAVDTQGSNVFGKVPDAPAVAPAVAVVPAVDMSTFTFDNGVDVELLNTFQVTSNSLGLNQEQANSLAALYAGHIAKENAAYQQQKEAQAQKQVQAIYAAPNANQLIESADAFLARANNADINRLVASGIFDTPEGVRCLAAMAELTKPPLQNMGGSGGKPLTAEEILYPGLK